MNPRLAAVLSDTENARQELSDAVAGLTADELTYRPAPDVWSIADVLEHLILVERSTVRLLSRQLQKARDAGFLATDSGASPTSLDNVFLPSSPRAAPDFVQPSRTIPAAALATELATSRSALQALALDASPWQLDTVTARHVALGELHFYQWVHFIGAHERRHLQQIKRLLMPATSPFANPAGTTGGGAEEYVRNLLALLGDRDPLPLLAAHADEVTRLTRGVPAADLLRSERLGKWSIMQVVQHLVDTEVVYAYRVRMILAHDTPSIEGYDQDRWATRLHYAEESLDDSLVDLRRLRGRNLRLVQRLNDAELDRAGIHAERGPESVRLVVRMIAAHDLLHQAQIARIRATLGLGVA